LLLGLALACAAPVSTQLREPRSPPTLRKLVVLPFASDPAPGGTVESDAAAVVATRVLEVLMQETGFEIVPPGEAARVHGLGGPAGGEELRRLFGSDAVLTGVVRRYVERSGGPAGASRPAAVWFGLELRTPDGELLWSGVYDETQRALSDDLGSLGRAWQRGFRWVTAADLAGYGARKLVQALAADIEPWS
jgi:hypothetical protein